MIKTGKDLKDPLPKIISIALLDCSPLQRMLLWGSYNSQNWEGWGCPLVPGKQSAWLCAVPTEKTPLLLVTSSSLRPVKQRWCWSTRGMLVCSQATSSVCLAKGSRTGTLWRGANPKSLENKKKKSFFQKERHILRILWCLLFWVFFSPAADTHFPGCCRRREQAAPWPTAKGVSA